MHNIGAVMADAPLKGTPGLMMMTLNLVVQVNKEVLLNTIIALSLTLEGNVGNVPLPVSFSKPQK